MEINRKRHKVKFLSIFLHFQPYSSWFLHDFLGPSPQSVVVNTDTRKITNPINNYKKKHNEEKRMTEGA